MNSEIIPFEFEDANIRVVNREGEPWFVLVDVCKVLGIANSRNVAGRLDQDDVGVHTVDTSAGAREVTITNESGVWTAVMLSRRPEARKFKRWITSEVIPQIRKTGGYGKPVTEAMAMLNDPAALRGLLGDYAAKVIHLENRVVVAEYEAEERAAIIQEQTPKVAALDRISAAEGAVCLRDAAKLLHVRERRLIGWLSESHWIYRRPGRGNWIAYSEPLSRGYLDHRIHVTTDQGTGDRIDHPQVLVTAKGIARIAERLEREQAEGGAS